MQFEAVEARDLDDSTICRLGVLLGRAYTDDRHVSAYPDEERTLRAPDIARVHGAAPESGELMPEDYLKRFPTWRNAARAPADRREAVHFVAQSAGYAASHVSLWAQYFVCDGIEVAGGYIEDVATDPLNLGQGLAMEGMRQAAEAARSRGLGVLGLATGLSGYYERLGWLPWDGDHVFHVAERNAAYPDQPLYLLPLSPEGDRLARLHGTMRSWRLPRFNARPGP